MARIERFLGEVLEIPEDRLYSAEHHLWFRSLEEGAEGVVEIGLTEPGIMLINGFTDLETLVEPGDGVEYDGELVFGTTGKAMKYVLSPFPGVVRGVNGSLDPQEVNSSPYATWLVRLEPDPEWEGCLEDAEGYRDRLAMSEHATEEAAKARGGKGSPTCKSLYGGIRGA